MPVPTAGRPLPAWSHLVTDAIDPGVPSSLLSTSGGDTLRATGEARSATLARLAPGWAHDRPELLEIVTLEENERRYLTRALEAKGGRVDACARAPVVPPSSLYQRRERLGVARTRS